MARVIVTVMVTNESRKETFGLVGSDIEQVFGDACEMAQNCAEDIDLEALLDLCHTGQ